MPFDCIGYVDDLTYAERKARDDLFLWLDRFPARVPALLDAVREGRIHGWRYVGACRCVIGTLGTPSDSSEAYLEFKLETMLGSRAGRTPIERFVFAIVPDHTPANSPVMALLERWIIQWQARA